MSEVKNAVKKQRIQQQPVKTETFKLLAENTELKDKIAGKTLWEVGQMFGLSDEDLSFEEDERVRKDTGAAIVIKSLGIRINGQRYKVNFSQGFKFDQMSNVDWLLSTEFRAGHLFAKEADGTPAYEEDGTRKFDMSRPYINLGNPYGLTSTRSTALFEEMTEEEEALAASKNS